MSILDTDMVPAEDFLQLSLPLFFEWGAAPPASHASAGGGAGDGAGGAGGAGGGVTAAADAAAADAAAPDPYDERIDFGSPPSGLGSAVAAEIVATAAQRDPLPFPMYLLAHKADSLAVAIAEHSAATRAAEQGAARRQRPGLHYADAACEREHFAGELQRRYPPAWYPSEPLPRFACGLSPDELGNYARLCGFRGWWWTSALGSTRAGGGRGGGAGGGGGGEGGSFAPTIPAFAAQKLVAATAAQSAPVDTARLRALAAVSAGAEAAGKKQSRSGGFGFFGLFGGSGSSSATTNSASAGAGAASVGAAGGVVDGVAVGYSSATGGEFGADTADRSLDDVTRASGAVAQASLFLVLSALTDDLLEYWGHV